MKLLETFSLGMAFAEELPESIAEQLGKADEDVCFNAGVEVGRVVDECLADGPGICEFSGGERGSWSI